jgi:hypothetical protein
MDIAFWALRAGLEVRAIQLVTPIHSGFDPDSGSLDEVQALLSVRVVVL